jgi:AraC-like DNA-binding protein
MSLHPIELPVQGILMYEYKHMDGDVVNEHHHPFHQILYALEGEGKMKLDDKESAFSIDHIAVILPKTEHSIVSDSKLTVLVLAFDESIFDSSIRSGLLEVFLGKSRLFKPGLFSGSELRHLLRKMLFEQSTGNNFGNLAMKIILSELLLVIARTQQSLGLSDANSMRAERIRQYIDTHYFENLSVQNIAAMLGMSTRYVNLIFKEYYNITPMRYQMDIRIVIAKKMLVETEKDISSICFELGFETVSTFYRIFKDTVHIPPNKYRTLYKFQKPDQKNTGKS